MSRTQLTALLVAATFLASCNNDHGGSGDVTLAPPPPPTGTIYAFGATSSPAQDGAEPKGSLTAVTQNGSTVLFGRTAIGGSNGCGTIFSVNPDGSGYSVQYRFGGADGCDPRHDAMTLNPNDNRLYATTQGVNQTNNATYGNQGQIFSFAPGTAIPTPITAVHTFTGTPDGAQQHSSFSIDPVSGLMYGMSAAGGASNDGLLYATSTDGSTFIHLHDFTKAEGRNPHGRIVLVNGVLYGIARSDGTLPDGKSGQGAVFSFTPTTPLASGPITVLHTFAGGAADGALSDHGYLTPVSVGGKTLLFGLTQCGGTGTGKDACGKSDGGGDGVLFQIDPSATPGSAAAFNVVYSFQGTEKGDGAGPYGSLMYDGTYLYGTTSAGGTFDKGTVFRVAPVAMNGTATPTILYHFGTRPNDGIKPIDNVIRIGNTLFGMTVYGGAPGPSPDDPGVTGNGTVFAIPLPN
ncbi:MAG: choice-of-anchor tandem repeat GloVer-containing protein [Burkholderiales bacterium]